MILNRGFICIFTLDKMEELRRFLKSYHKYNAHPISIILAKDIRDAHRIKTLCAFYTPFPLTALLDIDMLINGDLDELFDTALDGKIGIVREKICPVLNSGMLVFPREAMRLVCKIWNERYEAKLKKGFNGSTGTWDQDILNKIIKGFPHRELPSKWNHILKDYTPEQELEIYDQVKIFHFLHAPDIKRETYKSYQEFIKL